MRTYREYLKILDLNSMAVINYIDTNEFMRELKSKGLIIVSAAEFEMGKEIERRKLMRRKSLTLAEIVKANLLPVKTVKGVNDWIISGKIKADEWYRESSGYKRIMVATSAIKRLGYGD